MAHETKYHNEGGGVDNPTAADLASEIDTALHLLHREQTSQAAVQRVTLRTLRAVLGFTATNYLILIGEDDMALNTTTLDQNATEAKAAVVALAASHGTTEQQAQTIIDGAAQKFADLRDTAKAATPAAAPAQ